MKNYNEHSAGEPPSEPDVLNSPDTFAPGGEPRDVADGVEGESEPVEAAVEALRRELDAQNDRFLRLAAEYDNYRRRTQREQKEVAVRAQADLLRNLLDALDDLDRFAHVDPDTVNPRTVLEGVEMVEKKLAKSLAAAGLEVINPLDQPFDPALHEAMATEPALAPEDDSLVGRVYQLGYVLNGLMLRPARVVVRQWNG